MTTYGVTPDGFVKKPLNVIKTEIEDELRDTISPKLNLTSTTVWGQKIGIFSDKLREMWDVAEAVYRSFHPDYNTGDAQDNIAAITGVRRLPAQTSPTVLDQLFLETGTTLDIGKIVSVGSEGSRFVLTSSVSNALGYPATFSAAAESEEYGPIAGVAGSIDTIQTAVVGWSAKAQLSCTIVENYNLNGLTLTMKVDRETAQTVTFTGANPWTALQAATAVNAQTTDITALDAGGYLRLRSDTEGEGSSMEVTGGTALSVFGFSTAEIKGFNSSDAELGRDLETAEDMRVRREELLRASGSATVEAIRARLLELSFTTQVTVFENVTDVTDGDGVPPHSTESVVLGGTETDNWVATTAYIISDKVANGGNIYNCTQAGTSAASGGPSGTGTGIVDGTCIWDWFDTDDEQVIADTIWEVGGGGIQRYGTDSRIITDSQGDDHTIGYSRPTKIPIYMELTVVTDSDDFPATGSDQIKAALVAQGSTQNTGADVVALVYKCIPLEIAGVTDVTVFLIDDVTPPVGSINVPIASRELATFDTSDIDLTVT